MRRMPSAQAPGHEQSEASDQGPEPPESKPSVTLVLPAYNEHSRIGSALEELFAYLKGTGSVRVGGKPASDMGLVDVLVVDDGSTDDTAAIIEAKQQAAAGSPKVELLRRPHAGKGAAVQAGMLAGQGDLIIFADSDLATPPDQLPLLTAALADHDIALGSRVQPDGSDRRSSQPRYRRLLGRVFHALAAFWVTGPVPDTQCGFKGFTREAAHDLFMNQKIGGIVFDAEIIHLARKRGYSIAIVPVHWEDKRGSRMRVRVGLALRVVYDLFRIPLIHRHVPKR